MIDVCSFVGRAGNVVCTAGRYYDVLKERSATSWLAAAAGAVLEVIILVKERSHETDAGKMMLQFIVDYRPLTADGT